MKLRVWDRILAALLGVLSVLVGAGLLLYMTDLIPRVWIDQGLDDMHDALAGWQRWGVMALCVLLIALGIYGVAMLFRRRKDKGFVIQRTEYGDMSISMKAMENMVQKCVDSHSDLSVNHTRIQHNRDGVSVDLKITLASGANIPLTVNALQKQIRQYITSCSGVDVREVRVMVETDAARLPAPTQEPLPEAAAVPAAEEVKAESAAECVFQHKEEPALYTAAEPSETDAAVQPETGAAVTAEADETPEQEATETPQEPAQEADNTEEEAAAAAEASETEEAQV